MKFMIHIQQVGAKWRWTVRVDGVSVSTGYAENEDDANFRARSFADTYTEQNPFKNDYNYDYEVTNG